MTSFQYEKITINLWIINLMSVPMQILKTFYIIPRSYSWLLFWNNRVPIINFSWNDLEQPWNSTEENRTLRILNSSSTILSIILSLGQFLHGILLPFMPWGAHVGLTPLPAAYFPWLVLTLLGYCTLTQLVKFWYIKRFKQWL